MKKGALEDQDFASWIFIARTRDAIVKNRVKELNKYNLSVRQSTILMVLDALGENSTPAEISRWVFREQHSISDFLKRMERDGLIRRVKDLDRKNMIRVTITEKGREAVHNTKKMESIQKIMSSLTKGEHQQLRATLEKLWDKALEGLGINKRPIFPSS
jgi:DNA-binding MarR family transcriptional regulator